jgi:PTH2 family peptidyl-tRNA hydrolase
MASNEDEKECVCYIVVNSELAMGKGKIPAQCCHSFGEVIRKLERLPKNGDYYKQYTSWLNYAEPIIVLKATESQMRELLSKHKLSKEVTIQDVWCVETIDAGRTQIPAGSLTTLTFRPMPRYLAPQMIKTLKLL